MTEATSALIGYAVLRANFNASAPSYLDNFSPFVLDVLVEHHPGVLDEHQAAAGVLDHFGFAIPDRVVGVLLKRAVKAGQANRSNGGFVAADDHLQTATSITADISRFRRQQQELVAKYTSFLQTELGAPEELRAGDPGQQLDAFIETHAVPLLRQSLNGKVVSVPEALRGSDYAVSRFVAHLAETDAVAFGYVEEAVKGAILASVVGLDTSRFSQSLKGVTGYLDTPVLLKALGYQGPTQERAVLQTLGLARSLGMNITCFEHTVREVDGVLASAQDALRAKGRTPGQLREVDVYFQDAGMSAADIEVERAKLQQSLSRIGVRAQARPDGYYTYGLDETAVEDALKRFINYASPGTRRYDVDSLSAVHRLRKGSSPDDFERCGHVLVTDNGKVVRASREIDERHGWPLAMLDSDLAAFLWARSPGVSEDLPRQQLLATVYAGMQPGRHLWSKYLAEIETLLGRGEMDEDEAVILRSRPEARQALMDVTLGEEDTEQDSAAAVLDRVRADLERPLRDALTAAEQQAQSAAQEAEAARRAADERARTAQGVEQGLTTRVESVAKDLADLRTRQSAQDKSLRGRAERTVRLRVDLPILVLAVVGAAVGLLKFFDVSWLDTAPRKYVYPALGLSALFFIISGVRNFKGGAFLDWIGPLKAQYVTRLERKYRVRAGLPSEPSDP